MNVSKHVMLTVELSEEEARSLLNEVLGEPRPDTVHYQLHKKLEYALSPSEVGRSKQFNG